MEVGRGDDALAQLRGALYDLAAHDARELLEEARAQAREDVRALLARALRESMLSVIESELRAEPDLVLETASPPGAVYVYGVVSADTELGALPSGIAPGEPVRNVSESGLSALVSDVDGTEFSEARLREHMADIAWVQDTAQRHERVIEVVGAQVTVIPMRMCTVYGTEEDIRDLLRRDSRGLREALRYLNGKGEWGVKVFAPSLAAHNGREARAAAAQRADDAAKHVHEVLCAVATDSLIVSPQEYEARERRGELLLNGVYLVPDEAREDFRSQGAALARVFSELGIEIELTGPWPAYNFVPGTIGAAW